jgi:hypothetical protein
MWRPQGAELDWLSIGRRLDPTAYAAPRWDRTVRTLPDELRTGPFTRAKALELGATSRMLDGSRFVRMFPRVYRVSTLEPSAADWVEAARLALPGHAFPTGIIRIQQLGLDYGPSWPIRFVVEGDLHLVIPGIFLHRTKLLPPVDSFGATPAAAFIAYCARSRVVDAIKVGDWLLHRQHMTIAELSDLALCQPWRDGALEALWVIDHLDGRARSVMESETRAVTVFAGLPAPEVNVAVEVGEDVRIVGDLVLRRWGVLVEYEGGHHQTDRGQYVSDLERYALLRSGRLRYVQVTHEKLGRARTLVGEIYRALLDGGYDGPPPEFGSRWRLLFERVTDVIGARDRRARRAVG